MMHHRTGFAALTCVLTSLLVACGGPDAGRTGPSGASGKADELEGGGNEGDELAHRDAVITCEELAQRRIDRTNDERIDELVRAHRERLQCLVDANDDVVDVIDNALKNADASEQGSTSSRFSAVREAGQNVCNVLVEGSAGALDKSGSLLSQRCTADAEKNLADLVDAYVALSVDAITIPQANMLYATCYAAFEDAGAALHAEKVAALQTLGGCIEATNDAARAELIPRIIESFPGRELPDLEDETSRYFDAAQDAVQALCTSLSKVGEANDDKFIELAHAQCVVDAASQIGQLAVGVVPMLFDGVSVEPGSSDDGATSDGGTTDDGGTDDGGSTGGL